MRSWSAFGLALCVAGCGRIGFDEVVNFPDLAFRKAITITPPTTMTEALVDVPVHLGFSDADLAASIDPDGDDTLLADADGNRLAWELVDYASATGTLDAWVRIPELPPGETTTIYLHYSGKPHSRSSPWDPAAFAAVWHMNLDDAGAVDDRAGGHVVTAPTPAMWPTPMQNGIAGEASSFDGDDVLVIPDPVDGSLDFGMTSFSYSIWVFVTTTLGEYDIALHKGGSAAARAGYDFELGAALWTGYLSDGLQFYLGSLGLGDPTQLGRWTQLVVVVDRATATGHYYTNGEEIEAKNLSTMGSVDSDEALTFGSTTDPFLGAIDEVRVYRSALSPSRVAFDYANLATPAQVIAVGREQQ